jgi:ribosomal protein L11 methyltransferase
MCIWQKISIQLGTNLDCLGEADVMLANINKSVLLEHASSIRNHLKQNGTLLISGLLAVDYDEIIEKYEPIFGDKHTVFNDNGWIAILFLTK